MFLPSNCFPHLILSAIMVCSEGLSHEQRPKKKDAGDKIKIAVKKTNTRLNGVFYPSVNVKKSQ